MTYPGVVNRTLERLSAPSFLFIGLVALAGCAGDDTGDGAGGSSGSGNPSGSGSGSGGSQVSASGFSPDVRAWATPDGGLSEYGFNAVAGGSSYQGDQLWTTMDLDGDGKAELVVTGISGRQLGQPGARFWNVFAKTDDGFESTPTMWTTPDGGYGEEGFSMVGGGDDYSGDQRWSLLDMNGDGKPDLVVTSQSGNPFGSTDAQVWRVYENDGHGFATTPTPWSVPAGGLAESGFNAIAGGSTYQGDQLWTTMDLDGDKLPNLVVTAQSGHQPLMGDTNIWRVFKNTGSGFAPSSQPWTTPAGGSAASGFNTVAGGSTYSGDQSWAMTDLDGDGLADLVVTSESGRQFGTADTKVWSVFKNTGSGFSTTSTPFSTPLGGYSETGFTQIAGGSTYQGDQLWSTTDLDGDGLADLVVTAQSGVQFGMPGARAWRVFKNEGSGFAPTPMLWPTPDAATTDEGFYALAGGSDYSGDLRWATMDLDGDGRLDLIVTALSALQPGDPGARTWRLFPGVE